MTSKANNATCGIEKYIGTFEQDDLGVTQIPTETIRILRNITDLALYTFLASCSKDWKLNAKHLAAHFQCNKEKIYKSIDSLIGMGLLSRTITRDAGKFAKYHYRLHLRQIAQAAPFPEKPDTVKPDTVFPDTYKTNNLPLENKENITTTKVSSSIFTDKTINQILKYKLTTDTRTDTAFIQHAEHHITHNSDKTLSQYQRTRGLLKILCSVKGVNELFNSKGFIDPETKRIKQERANQAEQARQKAQDEQHAKRMAEYNKVTKRNA